jgi:hypothetical protein
MVNELNSELAMAVVKKIEAGGKYDRQMMLTILRQINTTLRPLAKIDRREKLGNFKKSEERSVTTANSH